MDGWVLGLEPTARRGTAPSASTAGQNWRRTQLSLAHRLTGEYVVRLRLEDDTLADPAPPAFAWEQPDCAYYADVRRAIPEGIQKIAEPWERMRALCAWAADQWIWRDSRMRLEYGPWMP